jgi:hypothetical protein
LWGPFSFQKDNTMAIQSMVTDGARNAAKNSKVSPSKGHQMASAASTGKAPAASGGAGSAVRGFSSGGLNPNAKAGSALAGTAAAPPTKGSGVTGFSSSGLISGKV